MEQRDDRDITHVRALHETFGAMRYERATQDRRTYYRLLLNGRSTGSLTDALHARQTIEYWRQKGWLTNV
jgi:hypothetical protein